MFDINSYIISVSDHGTRKVFDTFIFLYKYFSQKIINIILLNSNNLNRRKFEYCLV